MPAIDMAAYMAARRLRRRQELIALLGGVCTRCGTCENLEFDHVDRTTREFNLSGKGLDKPWPVLLAEVAKCQLLCKPHHLEKTREYGDNTGGGWNKIDGPGGFQHGTEAGYMRGGCRCWDCRKARYERRVERGETKGTRGMYKRSGVAQSGRVVDC